MSETTKIAWCDSTVNFWSGCTKVSAGCKHCYAEEVAYRFNGCAINGVPARTDGKQPMGKWGVHQPRRFHESAVTLAKRLNKKAWICDDCGEPQPCLMTGDKRIVCCGCGSTTSHFHKRRVFSLSLGDWLDPEVPIEYLARMLDTIRRCDQVTWILVTKRPELFFERLHAVLALPFDAEHGERSASRATQMAEWIRGNAPSNVIVMVSVEDQRTADERIPTLLRIPAICRGLSLEPLLGPVDLRLATPCDRKCQEFQDAECPGTAGLCVMQERRLDWLVIGGESGPRARPCNVEWVRSLAQQGQAAGVPVFVKQLGSHAVETLCVGVHSVARLCGGREVELDNPVEVTARMVLLHPKGGDPEEWPADLQVREWATVGKEQNEP